MMLLLLLLLMSSGSSAEVGNMKLCEISILVFAVVDVLYLQFYVVQICNFMLLIFC